MPLVPASETEVETHSLANVNFYKNLELICLCKHATV